MPELPELGPTEPNHTWEEKQDFIVRFIDEVDSFISYKVNEFELPPIVVIGALEKIKNDWMHPEDWIQEDEDEDEPDEAN